MVSVCLPSDILLQTYHLTWVSLTLDEGYLLTATPPDLECGVAPHVRYHIYEELKSKTKQGFPCGSAGKESAFNAGDLGSIPGLGRSPEKRKAAHSSILAWRIPWTV